MSDHAPGLVNGSGAILLLIMTSIRRVSNSPYWLANLTLPDGKRTTRSTKLTEKRLAQKVANEWQDASRQAKRRQLVENQARKVLNSILASVGQEDIPNETTESFFREWLAGKTNTGTSKRYKRAVDLFLAGLGTKSGNSLSGVTYRDVLLFVESRTAAGVAPKTLLVDLRALGAAFTLARKLGLIEHNPVEKALALQPVDVSSSERDCFTSQQLASLVQCAQGEWRTVVLLGVFTGARLRDCALMKWHNIDLDHAVVAYEPLKTPGKTVLVPIHSALLTHLQGLAAGRPEDFLCPDLARRATGGKNGLSAGFRRLMADAGVDARTDEGKGVRRFSKLSFHSLRHTVNSTLANGGVSQETRMEILGHSCVAVNAGYTHLDLAPLRSAIERLPTFGA